MGIFLLPAVVFYIVISIVAKNVAAKSRFKILAVAVVSTFPFIFASVAPNLLSFILASALGVAISILGLVFLIGVTMPQALKVTGIYAVFSISLASANFTHVV
jgi:hypothetical protein